jgi:hypothetical protein
MIGVCLRPLLTKDEFRRGDQRRQPIGQASMEIAESPRRRAGDGDLTLEFIAGQRTAE